MGEGVLELRSPLLVGDLMQCEGASEPWSAILEPCAFLAESPGFVNFRDRKSWTV